MLLYKVSNNLVCKYYCIHYGIISKVQDNKGNLLIHFQENVFFSSLLLVGVLKYLLCDFLSCALQLLKVLENFL